MVWFIMPGLIREFSYDSVSTWVNIFFVPSIYREHCHCQRTNNREKRYCYWRQILVEKKVGSVITCFILQHKGTPCGQVPVWFLPCGAISGLCNHGSLEENAGNTILGSTLLKCIRSLWIPPLQGDASGSAFGDAGR